MRFNIGEIPPNLLASSIFTSGEIAFVQNLSYRANYNANNVVLMNQNNGGLPGQVLKVNQTGTGLIWANETGGIGGSGLVGQIAFWTASNAISGDNNLFWDNTNKMLGIGTTSPAALLTLRKSTAGNVFTIRDTGDVANTFNITDTGSITIGTWQATPIAIAYGGTGLSALGTANQLLGVNSGATALEYKTLQGTANQINVAHSASTITLSTPQDIAPTSSPTFAGLTIGTLTGLLKGTSGVVSAVPAPTGDVVGTTDTQTLTNKRIQKRTSSTTTATSLTPDISQYDLYQFTSLSSSLTINNPIGNPVLGDVIVILIKDNGTSRTLSWGTAYKGIGVALPTATTAGKTMEIIAEYDGTNWLTSYTTEV